MQPLADMFNKFIYYWDAARVMISAHEKEAIPTG
jgi:hypothetical protein